MNTTTKLIPADNFPALLVTFAKMQKKAAKLGLVEPQINIINTIYKNVDDIGIVKFLEVQYIGNIPKISGWSFVGLIENVSDAAVVKSSIGATVPEHYRYSNPNSCDHCGINRKRSKTFIIEKSGKYMQVGKTCLNDFLGTENIDHVVAHSNSLIEFSDAEFLETSNCKPVFRLKDIVAIAHAYITKFGFVSSANANSTKSDVLQHVFNRSNNQAVVITEFDQTTAIEIVDEMKKFGNSTEFAHNVSVISNQEYVEPTLFGYIVAAVNTCINKRKTNEVNSKESFNSEPIGIVGESKQVTATVISTKAFQRDCYHYYDSGVSQLIIAKTDDDKLIKIFSNNMNIEKGNQLKIVGKVAEQEEDTYRTSPYFGMKFNKFAPRTRVSVV